jgi:hypothetical protein
MKHRALLFVSLLLAAILLSGCDFGIEGNIYVQDLVDLPTMNEPLYTPAVFSIGYSSDDRQEELNAVLEQNLRNVRNVRFEERDYTTNTVADFDVPILTGNNLEAGLTAVGDDFIAIFVEYSENNTATLYAVLNTAKFRKLQQTLKDEYWADITLEDATIVFNLINDMRTDVNVQVMSVYANSTPVPTTHQITMARRDELVIRFSDVLRDSLGVQYGDENPMYSARAFAVVTLPTE